MNLEKMIESQKSYDDRIVKEKRLEGKDLYPDTVLELLVELAELANEGRWFKYWSKDKEPRLKEKCPCCKGKGFYEYFDAFEMFDNQYSTEPCSDCESTGFTKDKNPLLEEYADCVHTFISVAIQKEWQGALWIYEESILEVEDEGFQGGLTGSFLEINYWLSKSFMELTTGDDKDPYEKVAKTLKISKQEFFFKNAWFLFLAVGLVGFEFTPKQIEEAFYDKDKINHQRLEQGY